MTNSAVGGVSGAFVFGFPLARIGFESCCLEVKTPAVYYGGRLVFSDGLFWSRMVGAG
ncbi:hypothetical protein [Neisseria elongata]|jgi:hypothetical protein